MEKFAADKKRLNHLKFYHSSFRVRISVLLDVSEASPEETRWHSPYTRLVVLLDLFMSQVKVKVADVIERFDGQHQSALS
ncbi:MAG: hypothetical protein AAF722_09200 [Cyanobacteria bacterium P01_C01_bin.70]